MEAVTVMKSELMEATRKKIVEARKAGSKASVRELWIEFYGAETPTIEDFADVCRSVDEDGQTEPPESPKKPVKKPDKESK